MGHRGTDHTPAAPAEGLSMTIRFALDQETYPIRPGRQAPRVVCVQSRVDGVDRLELREPGLDRL